MGDSPTTLRIVDVAASRFSLPMRQPVISAQATWTEREGVLLRLEDAAGRAGYGEASPLPGYSAETVEQAHTAIEQFATMARNAEGGVAIEASADAVRQLMAGMRAWMPPSIAYALELALLDLVGQATDRPVAALLAGVSGPNELPRTQIELHKLVKDIPSAILAARQGYRTLKVKIAVDEFEAEDRLLAGIREAVGPDVRLRLDANGALSPEEAIGALQYFSRYEIDCCEQPVDFRDLAGLAQVRREQPIPIAADESVRTAEDAKRVIDAEAADLLVIKPMLAGGLFVGLDIADQARAAGLPVFVTTTLEAAIGRAGCVHLAAALPNPLTACGLDTGGLLAVDLAPGVVAAGDGTMRLPDAAGLGVAPVVGVTGGIA